MVKNAASRSKWILMRSVSMDFRLPDSSSTEALGSALARAFPTPGAGAVIYLQGELGSGKTTCVRSLLRTLGVTAPVRSPTYTLVDHYSLAALECVHVDLYRVRSAAEVDELGLRDMTGPGSLLLIEWPERGGVAVPPADLRLTLNYLEAGREAMLRAGTAFGGEWLTNLGRDSSLIPYVSNLT
jgi:tRNA threonylcarbamoyladenosine biosynthesis protein TsaE